MANDLATFEQLIHEKEAVMGELLEGHKYLSAKRMLALASMIATGSYGKLRKSLIEMPFTVVNCFVQAADLGLEPNTKLNHCALVPFQTKTGKYACQLIIQYQGYVHLAISCGACDDVRGLLVYQSEIDAGNFYEQPTSRTEPIFHKLDPTQARPTVNNAADAVKHKVAGAYALAFLPSGVVKAKYMGLDEIEYIRKTYSKAADAESGYSPWEKRWSEQAIKTPLRNLMKTMRMTGEAKLSRAIELDETQWSTRHETELEAPDDPPRPVVVMQDADGQDGKRVDVTAGSERASAPKGDSPLPVGAAARSGGAEQVSAHGAGNPRQAGNVAQDSLSSDPTLDETEQDLIIKRYRQLKIPGEEWGEVVYSFAQAHCPDVHGIEDLPSSLLPAYLKHVEQFAERRNE